MITIEELVDRKQWCLDGKLHREDGPAIEWYNGDKAWYLNGKPHRRDGPAKEFVNGDKSWYLDGKLHREDGPATIWFYGIGKAWFLHNKYQLSDERKAHQINRIRDISIAFLILDLPPYVIFWILEWSESAYIGKMNVRSIIKMIEGIQNSRNMLKLR